MEKAKDMYQRKVRFPEDVRLAIERNGEPGVDILRSGDY